MLEAKFRKYLDKHFPAEKGREAKIARALGKHQSRINRWLRGKEPLHVSLRDLQHLARWRGLPVWKVMREIDSETVDRSKSNVASGLDDNYLLELEEIMDGDRVRSQRLLVNLRQQRKLGYIDLVSDVARLIINRGAAESAIDVANLLSKHQEKKTASITKLRAQMAAEFEEID